MVFVRGADIVGVHVVVFVQGVVVRLAMNVDMMFQFTGYLLCRVYGVAVTIFHH